MSFLQIIQTSFSLAIDTKAEQAIVVDLNTNEVLYEKNADEIIAPASMTKILTTYLVFDRVQNTSLSLDDTCNVSPKAYRMGGSKMFIEIDEKVTIDGLTYYEYANILYEKIQLDGSRAYEVVGIIDME